MRILTHTLKTPDKRSAITCKRTDEIGQVFPLDHAELLESGNGIVAQFEYLFLHIGKPTFKTGTIEWIFFACVYQSDRARRPKLSTAPFRKHGKGWVRHRRGSHPPIQGRGIRRRRLFIISPGRPTRPKPWHN